MKKRSKRYKALLKTKIKDKKLNIKDILEILKKNLDKEHLSWEDGKKVSLILLQPKQDSEAKKNLPPSTAKDAPKVTIGD